MNGIAISVSQPRSVMELLTRQSPSQFRFNDPIVPRCEPLVPDVLEETALVWPSPDTWPSYSMPSGLVPKTNAF